MSERPRKTGSRRGARVEVGRFLERKNVRGGAHQCGCLSNHDKTTSNIKQSHENEVCEKRYNS